MNYVLNWIQEDDFNLLHNMWVAKFSLLYSMLGAKYTICEAQSWSIGWKKVKFCKDKLMYLEAACFACNYLVVWQSISQQQDISTKHQYQQSNSFQDSPILSIRFEVLKWHVSAWTRRCWTRGGVTSIPTSIAPRLCCVCAALQAVSVCFALQIVQSASLHSFNFVFLVSARHWSVAGNRTRDWRAVGPCCQRAVRVSGTWKGRVK